MDEHTKCKGDNDPIDVLEIGYRVAKRGEVLQVKVLGTIALIDEGETDWKIFAIDTKDPIADKVNDINDVEKYFPGLMKATLEWFRIYKIPDGKPENQFAFNGEAKNKEYALKVIQEVSNHWHDLVQKKTDAGGLSCANVSVPDSPFTVDQATADAVLSKEPPLKPAEPIDASVDKWHFITLK
ncbi:inorganic diphosphatase activity protein [Homalodisca vitripennis]|nr:inorganic diphosphatase activity protein [Homalodisca vitripennis]